jgi:hypothetical protein
MNKILIAELEKLNETFPFRPFEVETLDGRRIRVTQRIRYLYEKAEGDIVVQGDVIAIIKYAELKDIIFILPPWKRPFSWLYYHPGWAAIPIFATLLILEIGGFSLLSRCEPQRSEQHK